MKKLNEIQKIVLTLYVIIFTGICLFYLPFYSGEYNTIWSDSGKVDLSKLGILILILSIIFFTAIKFSESFNKFDDIMKKKILKKELKIFLIFLLINLSFLLYFYLNNGINYLSEIKLIDKINSNKLEIKNSFIKKETRREFWDYVSNKYNMSEFNNKIGDLWDFMQKNKDDENWVTYYLSNFDKDVIIKFKIKNSVEFREFIENNILEEADFLKERNNVFLESENIEKTTELKQISYYSSELIRIYMVYIFLSSIFILYILRIFFIKVLKILKE